MGLALGYCTLPLYDAPFWSGGSYGNKRTIFGSALSAREGGDLGSERDQSPNVDAFSYSRPSFNSDGSVGVNLNNREWSVCLSSQLASNIFDGDSLSREIIMSYSPAVGNFQIPLH
jgi:hypothetical protein